MCELHFFPFSSSKYSVDYNVVDSLAYTDGAEYELTEKYFENHIACGHRTFDVTTTRDFAVLDLIWIVR